jgi:hypothetical protein
MSWDTYLAINTGIDDIEVIDVGNYTYNVGKMYNDALGFSYSDFDGMLAKDAIQILKMAIEKMEKNPKHYEAMNPENNWGNYDGALKYLKSLHRACEDNPLCKIVVT